MSALDEIREFAKQTPCRNSEMHQQCTRQDRDRLLAAVEAVLGVHQPTNGQRFCGACIADHGMFSAAWPCPTVKAINAALEAKP